MAVPPDAMDALRDVAVVWEVALTVIGAFAAGPARRVAALRRGRCGGSARRPTIISAT